VNGFVWFLNIFFVFLSDASYALIIGVLLATRWTGTIAESAVPVRPLRVLVGTLILGQFVRPWFVAASMSGSSDFRAALGFVPDVLRSTRQGKLWLIGSALILILAVVLLSRLKGVAPWMVAALLLLLAAVKAASGHPAAVAGDFMLTESSQFFHILGTSVWAGAVIVSGCIVLPRLRRTTTPEAVREYGMRLSALVTWALIALLASGIFTADRELNGSLRGLWTSGWGRILSVKIVFVLTALALGAVNRHKGLKGPPTENCAALLARVLCAEAVVMAVILGLSAALANTAPPIPE
jgi:putative copper export protein